MLIYIFKFPYFIVNTTITHTRDLLYVSKLYKNLTTETYILINYMSLSALGFYNNYHDYVKVDFFQWK